MKRTYLLQKDFYGHVLWDLDNPVLSSLADSQPCFTLLFTQASANTTFGLFVEEACVLPSLSNRDLWSLGCLLVGAEML